MTKREPLKKSREYGEGILAVANSCRLFRQNNNTNRVNSLTSRQKLFRNITEGSTAGSMSMTFMQGRATYSMSSRKMKKLENNSKISLEKLLSKKQNFKSKLRGQNSMSWLLTFIILRLQKPSRVYTILHTHN